MSARVKAISSKRRHSLSPRDCFDSSKKIHSLFARNLLCTRVIFYRKHATNLDIFYLYHYNDSMEDFAHIYLKPKEEIEIKRGFPWVYDNEIALIKYGKDGTEVLENGSIVEVFSKAGDFVGTGVFNSHSRINVRIFSQKRASIVAKDTDAWWLSCIQRAYDLRQPFFSKNQSYRMVFAEADMAPGLIVDRYVDTNGHVYIVVEFMAMAVQVFRHEIIKALRKIAHPYAIYERSIGSIMAKEGLKERECFEGEVRDTNIVINDGGILFNIDIKNGQKTGHFLDQSRNHSLVASLSKDREVLDAFCHTGGFALSCAKAGAKAVTAVDISPLAIAMLEKNATLNNIKTITTVTKDVFDILRQYESENRQFDMVILDPPAFAKSASSITKAYGGYKEINLRAMHIIKDGGYLVTCSCSYYFDSNKFYAMLDNAALDAHKKLQFVYKCTAAPDHPIISGYSNSEYLKMAVCRVL